MKALLWILAVFISLASASAYTIDGDTVYIEDANARLAVTPHTVDNPRFNWQYFTVDSKLPVAKDLCIAYVFDSPLNSTSVELLDGGIWNDVKGQFNHVLYNDRHYYYTENSLSFDALGSHSWRIRYDPMSNTGKWDLMAWDDTMDDCRETFITGSYNVLYELDPWFNASLSHCRTIEFQGSDAVLTDFPHYYNLTDTTDFNLNGTGIQWVSSACDEDGVELSYEITNITSDNIDFWVKSNTSTTPYNISVYYDEENDDSFNETGDTWSNGYRVTLHHHEGSGTILYDSTDYNNPGTTNADWTGGVIDNATDYDSLGSEYTYVSKNIGSDWNSFSQWVLLPGTIYTGLACEVFIGDFGANAWTGLGGCSGGFAGELVTIQTNTGKQQGWNAADIGVSSYIGAGWHHYAFVWNTTATRYNLIFDGDNKGTGSLTNGAPMALPGSSTFSIARHNAFYYDHIDDETRVSSSVWTPEWVKYDYELMTNQSVFVETFPQENITVNTSFYAAKADILDASFASDTYVEIAKDEFDLNGTGGNYYIVTSYNILKTAGGASNDVYMNISRDDVTLADVLVRSVSGLNDEGSVVYFINDSISPARPVNISLSFRRTGVGTIEINDIDLVVGIASTTAGYNASDINISQSVFSTDSASFVDTYNFTARRNVTSSIFFMQRSTVNSTVSGRTDARFGNRDISVYSPIWSRYLSGATDTGALFGSWIDCELDEALYNYTIQSEVTAGAVQMNTTYLYMVLADTNNNTVVSENDTRPDTNLTGFVDLSAGTHKLGELNVTMQGGSGMFLTAQATIGTQSLAQTPVLYINDSHTNSDCYSKKERLLSGASDIGNIGITTTCDDIGVGNSSTINLWLTVSAGETVRVYDEILTGFEITNISVIQQNTAPIWLQEFDNQTLAVGSSFTDTASFFDAENNDLNSSSNCTFLTVNINNATDIVTINYTAIAAHENTTQYCFVSIDDSEFVTESNTFSINVTPAPVTPPSNGVDAYTLSFSACDLSTTAASIAIVGFAFLVVVLNLAAYLIRFRFYSIMVGAFTWIFAFYVGVCAFGLVYMFLILGTTTFGHGLIGDNRL